MAYASQSGKARTSAKKPQAFAVCDRCGIWHNWVNLRWQYDWRGPTIQNLRILVCSRCYDTPQEQLRAIVLPADPVPIINARVENFVQDSTDYRSVSGPVVTDPITGLPIPSTTLRVTEECQNRTLQPIGHPEGLSQNAVMPYDAVIHKNFDVLLPVLSVSAIGCIVTVTCSAVHNLQPNYQVSIEGLQGGGNGFYSVCVPTATVFTYQTTKPVTPSLTPATRMVTALVGLPYGYEQIPNG